MLFKSFLLVGTASATCLHNLQKFKRAEGEVQVGTFGYTGLKAPLNWAALAEENEACKTGSQQSPINIDDSIALATEKPTIDIPEQEVEFENLGTTIEVVMNGTTTVGETQFRLKQFHLHTPSEHRIGEEYFPLEAHFVHEGVADATQIAVMSVLFNLASNETATPFISGLVPSIPAIATPGTKTPISSLDFASVVEHLQTTELFQYTGSLTTPPCSEGVLFMITKEPMPLDIASFNAIKSVVKFNSRYTQNVLGQENMIAIAEKAGTAEQSVPEAEPEATPAGNETATNVAVIAGAPSKGATIVIAEMSGTPLPTPLEAVVVKRSFQA